MSQQTFLPLRKIINITGLTPTRKFDIFYQKKQIGEIISSYDI